MVPGSLYALISTSTLVLSASIPARRATVCSDHAELCDRLSDPLANSVYLFYDIEPVTVAHDQEVDIPTQLGFGVRLLQGQAHTNGDLLHFCNTSCDLFDGGSVQDYLTNVKTFLDANPNEVLTLLFTNPEGASVFTVWKPAFGVAEISDLAFVPPSLPVLQSNWSTLGSMIDSGKRVVVVLDAGADGADAVNFILPEFQMIWETLFSVTGASFPCSIDRINVPLAAEDHRYMINHSLNKNIIPVGTGVIVSDLLDASTTNGVDSILANANGCAVLVANRAPNFVLLDLLTNTTRFTAANQLNGLA
ncbi:PLC-like phosphodiesterase [Mycena capillaripes]|nr:PLC-like phosphodiesterase [Mycena capillaripes]